MTITKILLQFCNQSFSVSISLLFRKKIRFSVIVFLNKLQLINRFSENPKNNRVCIDNHTLLFYCQASLYYFLSTVSF